MDLRNYFLFLSFVGVAISGCLDGWLHFGTSCFYINKFDKLSWAEASSDCRAFGAQLAIVDDTDTVNFLFTKINPTHQRPANGICQIEEDFWIDGTDQVVEGHWIWASTSAPLDGNHWCPGNPSNSGGHEDCMEFKDGHWNDDDCHKLQPFICQMEYNDGGQSIIG